VYKRQDLGGGVLKFNKSTVRTSVRNTVPEVYTIGIFPDLKQAIIDLPETPRIVGAATKTVARLYLAKAYLTYAWWLQNPNNIPTYPETARTDKDGKDAAWYFQQAYDVATEAIANPGYAGLQPTYYRVHLAQNDRNNEILLLADHTNASEQYNGGISFSYGNGEAPDNFAAWMVTPQMENIRSAKKADGTDLISSVQREAAQWGGRPWTRMAPPQGVFTKTFADKTNDSRFDGTFTSVYRGNWTKNASLSSITTLYNANNMPVSPGDAILTFLPDESLTAALSYTTGKSLSLIHI
jgi:hypothetical protein